MKSKKEISQKETEREIIEFLSQRASRSGGKHTCPGCNLKHGTPCVLGTCHDNIPRTTPVDFFYDGSLTVWICSEPGGKIANIMRNPNVALGICDSCDHSKEQKSLQLWGTAELINSTKNPDLFAEKWTAFGLDEATAGMLEENIEKGLIPDMDIPQAMAAVSKKINLIKITPSKITLLIMRPDGRHVKKTWEKDKAYSKELSAGS